MAEIAANPLHSYDLQVETKLNIDELIYMYNPRDLPLFAGIGADGAPVLTRVPVDNRKFHWLDENVPLPRTTLATGINDLITSVVVPAGEAVRFAPGDNIMINAEFMAITAVNTSTDTLTVVRGAQGSTAAAALAGAEILGIGTVLAEGEIGDQLFRGREKRFNNTQIWTSRLEMTRTEQRIPKYGVPNELNKQLDNTMLSEGVNMEQAALYGIRWEDTATQRRTTGGLNYFITGVDNVDTTTAWITIESIEALQEVAYGRGGGFEYVMAQPAAFGALNNMAGSERIQTVTIDDARRGRRRATSVMTEYGEVMLVRNRWVRARDGFCYSRDGFQYRQFQPAVVQRLAKTKDTDSYMWVAEGGFQVKGPDHMAKFTALDTSAAFPTPLV